MRAYLIALCALLAVAGVAYAQSMRFGAGLPDLPALGGKSQPQQSGCLLVSGTTTNCVLYSGTTDATAILVR